MGKVPRRMRCFLEGRRLSCSLNRSENLCFVAGGDVVAGFFRRPSKSKDKEKAADGEQAVSDKK